MAAETPRSAQLQEAFEHLWKGRFRLVLPLAQNLIRQHPENADAAVCYAWAVLENGDMETAQKYLEISKHASGQGLLTQMYRGYVQMRLSSFEAAIYDFNMIEGKQKELLAWTYLNKAKSLACIGEAERAQNYFDLALMIDNNANPGWKGLRKYFSAVKKLYSKGIAFAKDEAIKLAQEAFQQKEYWFALICANELLKQQAIDDHELLLIQLEAMYRMNQKIALEQKVKEYEGKLSSNARFIALKTALLNTPPNKEGSKDSFIINTQDISEILELHPNKYVEVQELNMFNAATDKENKKACNFAGFDFAQKPVIGLKMILKNLNFGKQAVSCNCFYAWFLDDEIIAQSGVSATIPPDWDMITLEETVDTNANPLWTKGNARLEFFINKEKIFTRRLVLGDKDDLYVAPEKVPSEVKDESKADFSVVFDELNAIIGLAGVKESVRSLFDYLEVIKERKALGLKAQEKISVHATFLGNPGTGKTTVARLMGKIFKGMGLLSKGEVIEVDRSSLVGQYVGETAQKTDKIIEDAIGNVLFIDEAYTLVKKGQGNDFGQEAIDILLKRMEDRKGEFFVIAAGYPDEMKDFLEANPGLRSRFTHHFNFEDYTPDEMLAIFRKMVADEDYRITDDAEKVLLKEFTRLYRSRDKNFGNARTVRKIFEDAKMQVSQQYLKLAKHERTMEKLTTITADYMNELFSGRETKKTFTVPVNEEMLQECLAEVNKLTGLTSVKQEITELIKLAKYYREAGEDLSTKFSSHIVFLGNPGTGKTTVARIISRIYAALGILPGGQLIETDRQGLVAAHVGETALKATALINKAIGGTLFIDEAYTLVKKDSGGDFGQEAIDVLLKRMEDDRGKFIVIAAGYTDEMKAFLESNPGLKSRFTKIFTFEDYNADECIEICKQMSKKSNVSLGEEVLSQLHKYFNGLYRARDKNFGNARLVRNTFDAVIKAMNLRVSDLPPMSLTDEERGKIIMSDLKAALPSQGVDVRAPIQGDADKLQALIA